MNIHLDFYRRATLAAVAGALIALTGCAGMGAPASPEEQVKARAQERRDAIVKGDWAKAYEFFTPGYRAALPRDTYVASIGKALANVGATVESVKCETLEKCVATVQVVTKPLVAPRFTGTITTYADETWLLEAGQWWLFVKL